MKYNYLHSGNNGLGLGTVHFVSTTSDAGIADYTQSTDIRMVNACKVAVDKNGEAIEIDEAVIEKIANDAAKMSGVDNRKKKILPMSAMMVK